MEVPFGGVSSCRCLYLCLLVTFIYLAFVSTGAHATPYFTSGPSHSRDGEDNDPSEALNQGDVLEMCARPDISTATKVLCRLVRLKEQKREPEILPMRQLRLQRVHKRESSSLSSFQRTVDTVRKLAEDHSEYRRVYNKLISKGLISSNGVVIDLPTDSSLQNRMRITG